MRISTQSPGFHSVPQRAEAQRPHTRAAEDSPIQTVLFGTVIPKRLDPAQFPQLAEQMRWLNRFKMKIAAFLGDHAAEYEIALAEGMAACVDAEGTIFLGEKLIAHSEPALIAGILAHEIGHRPKTWKKHKQGQGMSRAELLAFARDEEAKADRSAGRALAALDMSPEPICAFLLANGNFERQPENYYAADVRVTMIREAYAAQKARKNAAKSLFPAFHKASDVKQLIADERTGSKRRRRT